jgi:hypothetical protein
MLQLRDALSHDLLKRRILEAAEDFKDVHDTFGYEVTEFVELLEARLDAAGDVEVGAGDGG